MSERTSAKDISERLQAKADELLDCILACVERGQLNEAVSHAARAFDLICALDSLGARNLAMEHGDAHHH